MVRTAFLAAAVSWWSAVILSWTAMCHQQNSSEAVTTSPQPEKGVHPQLHKYKLAFVPMSNNLPELPVTANGVANESPCGTDDAAVPMYLPPWKVIIVPSLVPVDTTTKVRPRESMFADHSSVAPDLNGRFHTKWPVFTLNP
eukprot:TRINITY_DN67979_c2_g5_i2.p3 TRINITY_DN67979_c2_g5~~TRINITY_DN67979_c2_g5_i2.p3  ORF type:complete len:142 (-),score=10.79 TRINITY_DN67979_c2_g5_i2:1165-1590(-)